MNLLGDTYIGAVTAITFSPDGKFILYGSGSFIHIYDNKSFQHIGTVRALVISAIHGIRFCGTILCVFGRKEYVLFNWDTLELLQFKQAKALYRCENFVDWIWDIAFMSLADNPLPHLLIGTAHNTIVLWNPNTNHADHFYYGRDRCILYSMSILNLNGEYIVASGTVFKEVHIWSLSKPEATIVCRRHAGVIFKLCWSPDGRYLLSVSDDRTVVVWRHSAASTLWDTVENTTVASLLEGEYTPLHRLFGHHARLWDCIFTPHCIVTTSEDCTVRVWSAAGSCLAVMGGHKGKHVWCVAYDSHTQVAATGGNDGSVKLWDLSAITNTTSSTHSFVIPTMQGEVDQVRNSRSECIRDVRMARDGASVLIASNWGYVWSLDPSSGTFHPLFEPSSHEFVTTLALSEDGEICASGTYSGDFRVFSVHQHFPTVQEKVGDIRIGRISIHSLDAQHWLICVVAANSHVTLFTLERETGALARWEECDFGMKGVITSVFWVVEQGVLVAGDSAGGVLIAKFRGSHATKYLRKCHGFGPVCAITVKDDVLWTGGHDGKVIPISVDWETLECTLATAIPIPQVKQLFSIWWSDQEELCVAGFHDTDYVVMDMTNMYEVLRVTTGGWKRPFSAYHCASHPSHGYVFAYASANGYSSVCVFERKMQLNRQLVPALTCPTHGREVNVVHWICADEKGGLLASGGEDRKLQIIRVDRSESGFDWKVLQAFETHSSSIRGICSYLDPDAASYTMLSCGSRNTLCVWKVSLDGSECRLLSMLPIRDSQNRVDGGDVRYMDISTYTIEPGKVVILLGDSKGQINLFMLTSSNPTPQLLFCREIQPTPILCVDLCFWQGQLFGFAGTAAGDLLFFNVTSFLSQEKGELDIHEVKAVHVMGVNDIRILLREEALFCVSVGDDQSLRICQFAYEANDIVFVTKKSYPGVSGTSLRSLCAVESGVYFTGWEQVVQRWVWVNVGLVISGRCEVQVPETAYIDMIEENGHAMVAVCGAMGIEVFECSV